MLGNMSVDSGDYHVVNKDKLLDEDAIVKQ